MKHHNARQGRPNPRPNGHVALAYVGCVVPDEAHYRTPALSPAGQMYQLELLRGLVREGLAPSAIFSALPMPAFPRCRQLWVRGRRRSLADGTALYLLPFVNLTPLKQVAIGVGTLCHLLRWGYATRGADLRLVYTYNLSVPPGLFTLVGARLIGAKAVVSLCDVNIPGDTVPNRWPWRLDYWLHHRIAALFDGHVVASDAVARDFAGTKPWMRLEGGVRDEQIDSESVRRTMRESDRDEFRIAVTGRLDETNGIPVILKACSLLGDVDYRLHIAGAGPLEQQVRAAAAANPRIRFHGMIPFSEVLNLYSNSDVLVNMRITNSIRTDYFFPSKMMEYLASGTPVITTCTGHIEREFGEFVHLLRDESPEGLARIIRRVAGDEPRERIRKADQARSFMLSQKTWAVQTSRLAEFLRTKVLGEALPHPRALNPLGTEEQSEVRG